MQISLVLGTVDTDIIDHDDYTGLTEVAFLQLTEALTSIGFEFVEGPKAVR